MHMLAAMLCGGCGGWFGWFQKCWCCRCWVAAAHPFNLDEFNVLALALKRFHSTFARALFWPFFFLVCGCVFYLRGFFAGRDFFGLCDYLWVFGLWWYQLTMASDSLRACKGNKICVEDGLEGVWGLHFRFMLTDMTFLRGSSVCAYVNQKKSYHLISDGDDDSGRYHQTSVSVFACARIFS